MQLAWLKLNEEKAFKINSKKKNDSFWYFGCDTKFIPFCCHSFKMKGVSSKQLEFLMLLIFNTAWIQAPLIRDNSKKNWLIILNAWLPREQYVSKEKTGLI